MKLSYFDFKFQALGGSNLLKLAAPSEEEAKRTAQLAIDEVQRIEQKFSRYREDSILSKINDAAGEESVEVDTETAELLNYAAACHKESQGLFDITSGVLRKVWDFKSGALPSQSQIDEILPLIGWEQVAWDGKYISLPTPQMQIDFGGIGKEYAAERAVLALKRGGVLNGFVNLSGDVAVIGPKLDGSPWRIGVQHPRKEAVLAGLPLLRGALATSGDYERFFEVEGKRYCHILNPKTGYPVEGFQAVTVFADSCLIAGSMSTIAMLLGEEKGKRYLSKNKMKSLAVTGAGEVWESSPSNPV